MQRLESVRLMIGNKPLPVTSGYRCPVHNCKVSKTGPTGPHTHRRAVDVQVSGRLAYDVVRVAPMCGMTGIGVSQKGLHGKRFIHLDDLRGGGGHPRPWIWSY